MRIIYTMYAGPESIWQGTYVPSGENMGSTCTADTRTTYFVRMRSITRPEETGLQKIHAEKMGLDDLISWGAELKGGTSFQGLVFVGQLNMCRCKWTEIEELQQCAVSSVVVSQKPSNWSSWSMFHFHTSTFSNTPTPTLEFAFVRLNTALKC